jgi:hypothetical protein
MQNLLEFLTKLIVLFCFCSGISHSADLASLNRLFYERFNVDWEENKCGENTAKFVKAAIQRKINLSRAIIVGADNPMGDFAMLAGYQARQNGYPPSRNNWFFHAFLIAQETVDIGKQGKVAVYDLSFKNEPTILNLTRYLDQMFIPPQVFGDPNTRTKYLQYLKFNLYDAKKYVTQGQSSSRMFADTYLRNIFPSYYKQQSPNDGELFEQIY